MWESRVCFPALASAVSDKSQPCSSEGLLLSQRGFSKGQGMVLPSGVHIVWVHASSLPGLGNHREILMEWKYTALC